MLLEFLLEVHHKGFLEVLHKGFLEVLIQLLFVLKFSFNFSNDLKVC